LRSAILDTLPRFDVSVVPLLVAALDVNDVGLRLDLLNSLRKRSDYLSLPSKVETDIIPHLWYFAADLRSNPKEMRDRAREMIRGLLDRDPDADRDLEHRLPQWQLAQFARKFLERKGVFSTPVNVFVWKWDGAKPVVSSMSISDAEEYYGLRYARWGLEIQPNYPEAQKVFITLALEKHYARAGTDVSLAKSAPSLYAVLITAPYGFLTEMLETALQEHRVPMAVSLIQAIGDRTEVRAARPSEKSSSSSSPVEFRPSLLMKALDYPDRRVQFAAVDALLKAPGAHAHQRGAQIIKILNGYLMADPPEPDSKPKAMIGDGDRRRAEALASLARQSGFDTEIALTGKEVIRRLQEKADIDLVLIDHHLQLPSLPDFLAQVRADLRTRPIPLAVVASPDHPTSAHPITLLARLAVLVAAAEHVNHIKTQAREFDARRESVAYRLKERVDAMKTLVEAAGIEITADVRDRLEYLILMTTPPNPMDFPLDKPELDKSRLVLPAADRFHRMNSLRLDPKRGHIAADEPPFSDSRDLTPKLAAFVARHEVGMPQDVLDVAKVYWNIMQSGQMESDGRYAQRPLPAVSIRHPEIEARIAHLIKNYRGVRVLPDVTSNVAFKEELQAVATFQDPKALEAEKKGNAKAALEWLRKMAVGELPGYPVADAEAGLRLAMQKPEFAALAIDAVSRFPSKEAQQDIASVILGGLPPEIRAQAADALIKHIQLRGKMISPPQQVLLLEKAKTEESPEVKARLLALKGILSPDPKDTGSLLLGYRPPAAVPKVEPKKEEEPKKE
jgi:CheY-like chemotaxis protein